MKMQNVEMEFVTFGSQDILTTSGGSLLSQLSVIRAYNDQYAGGNSKITSDSMLNYQGKLNGFEKEETQSYWIVYNVDEDDTKLRTAEARSTEDKPDGNYFLAGDANGVYRWLELNGHTFRQ